MRLAVVGAGAMGGALAAEASAAGHDVHVLDASPDLVAAIRARGIRVREGDKELTAHVSATTDPADIGPVDVAVIFVKAQHTAAAARSVATLCDQHTVVASLQNGWGNADVIAGVLGADRLVFGVTYHSCSVTGVAEVAHTGRGDTVIGAYGDGPISRPCPVADLLSSAGWSCQVIEDVRTEIWKKLILNAATLPTAALTGLTAGELGADPDMLQVVDAAALEACAVARGLGLQIDPAERVERIRAVLTAAGAGKPSMLQDALAHRKTEIDVINAAVVSAAGRVGVAVPVNAALTSMIRGLERSWSL